MADTKEKEKPVVVTDEVKKAIPVDVRFRDMLMELVYDVSQGAKLAEAKHKMHAWVEDLSPTDKDVLYQKAAAVSKRVRDIADSLTSETPALLVRMMPSQDNI